MFVLKKIISKGAVHNPLEILWIMISDLKQSDHETSNELMNPFQSGGFVVSFYVP